MAEDREAEGGNEGGGADTVVGKGRVDLEKLGLVLLPMEQVHRNFVISTWVLSAADAMSKRGPRRPLCKDEEDVLAKRAIEAGTVYVLADAHDTEVLHGWICGRRGLLQWGYLPPLLRKRGIFREMVRQVCGKDPQYTRRPKGYRVPGYWTFNPYRMSE